MLDPNPYRTVYHHYNDYGSATLSGTANLRSNQDALCVVKKQDCPLLRRVNLAMYELNLDKKNGKAAVIIHHGPDPGAD
jgi:hypothetical protein